MTSIPRIIIAGTHSGCGKTTVASGIMAALTRRGLTVQPFKVGPDFIDPTHHTRICGRISRNLDPFMMGENGCIDTFTRATHGSDIAVIEGVMGIYDGVDGSDISSTAHVARILKSPVILVVDVKGMSRSVHALVDGYCRFDPSLSFSGVILNRIGSQRHRSMIEPSLTVPSFGFIPRKEELAIESRHLGLKMGHETRFTDEFGKIINESCDLDALVKAAEHAPALNNSEISGVSARPPLVKIGVAFDDAFCFYYQDNLDRLCHAGAELVFFSPQSGPLPDVDAVYLGGGYPELHLNALESSPVRQDLKQAADAGMPVYGECGGLMYLTEEIRADKNYRMCGILPAKAEMTSRIQALGYVKGESTTGHPFAPSGQTTLGHEFHYSRLDTSQDARFALRLSRGKGIDGENDGLISHNVLGCYTHTYFTPSFAEALVDSALRFSKR
jgi:cobyrinic acid a,c-diamide synthase